MKKRFTVIRILIPVLTFIFFGSISVFLWDDHNNYERELILHHTETAAVQIKIRIEGLMNARMASLELLAERWIERRPPDFSKKRFLQFASAFYSHYPGFTGINWMDPDGVIQWVFPEVKNRGERGKNLYHLIDPLYRETLQRAKHPIKYFMTPCLKIDQEGLGFHTFWPLIYEGELLGFLNGVFQISTIMDTCLAKNILKDFWIRFYENKRLIFTNGKKTRAKRQVSDLPVNRPIRFTGKTWRLEIVPGADIYPQGIIWNLPFLVFGLAISATLALILYFFLMRIEMYREARDDALHEVNERKKAEAALRENEKRLEELLGELEAKNRELETFTYSVSHDLKTPIVTIEGYIGAFREDFGSLLTEKSERYFNYMSNATQKMALLIDDLLKLSRIGHLPGQKREFSFASIVQEVLTLFKPQIEQNHIEINIVKDFPVIYGDKKQVLQMMENLLSNALKYLGKDNPSPRIDMGVEKKDGHDIFFVKDNGIGIEARYFDKMFEGFQRLPHSKSLANGTGLGLTIVKRVIENHGGRIWLTSEPGKGTTFFFTLKP
ncbi:MAG: ATP-binding protein [Thermodesulfobacteriota bacterium]|nr:ATP-binding protein [Thermodesulfobacteriota bacterium]